MRNLRVIPFLFVVMLVAGACGGSSPNTATSTPSPASSTPSTSSSEPAEASSGAQVAIEDFAFAPKRIKVSAGDAVTWTNKDDILHTVTSGRGQKQGVPGVTENKDAKPDGMFDQEVDFEETFEFTFDDAGTYAYFCAIHPGMVGTLVVE